MSETPTQLPPPPRLPSKLVRALIQFSADVETITAETDGIYNKYATLPTVLSTILPSLRKNGLYITQTFSLSNEGDKILNTILLHEEGESIESHFALPINSGKNVTHENGKSITYFRRYCLLAILGIAVGIYDDDGEICGSEKETPALKPVTKTSAPKFKTSDADDIMGKFRSLKDKKKKEEVIEKFTTKFDIEGPLKPSHINSPEHIEFLTPLLK